jgi:hypothetical protein
MLPQPVPPGFLAVLPELVRLLERFNKYCGVVSEGYVQAFLSGTPA